MRDLVAVQAQDYGAGLWAIGQRLATPSRTAVERALADRTLVRTWPMRGTLHVVAAADVHWLTALLAPRILKRAQSRYRALGLDAKTFAKARALFEKHLAGGVSLTRPELFALLSRAKIEPGEQRGIHILGGLAMERVLCLAAHRGKQPSFALLDEWVAKPRALTGDAAYAELTRRYFAGHGPASIADLQWWTGLNLTEARRAVELVPDLEVRVVGGVTYYGGHAAAARGSAQLLSAWDELTVGYRDRSASVDPAHAKATLNGLAWSVAVDGRLVGLWRRDKGVVSVQPFGKLDAKVAKAVERATQRYRDFTST